VRSHPSSALEYVDHLWVTPRSQPNDFTVLKIEKAVWMNGHWKIKMESVDSPESVKAITQSMLWVERHQLRPTLASEYYVSDLVGCEVLDDETGKAIGILDRIDSPQENELTQHQANDIWWIRLVTGKDVAIPATKEYVVAIDSALKHIRVKHWTDFQ